MRGLTISAHGGTERIEYREDLVEPVLRGAGDVRIRMRAAALNHLDLFLLGGLPGVTITPPWILGADGMGVVESVGSAVTTVRVGDTVVINPGLSDRTCEYCLEGEQPLCPRYGILGEHFPGTMAELVVVPATNVLPVREQTDESEAAAFTLATLTAYRMLVTRAHLRANERVLIWGIGGGVALACLQIAKLIGAHVTVTSGSDDKLAAARKLGADDAINHTGVDVGREIRARTAKRGVDVVVDSVGEATWAQSLGALGRRGRLVTCGGTSGPMVTTDVRRLFWNQWSILGSTMGNDAEFAAVVGHFNAGRLRPPIDQVYRLSEGRLAFERLATAGQFGKIVLRID
ncbi:MAG: zinc-binding dehydrogenase [Gemmatimonadaceae bacterium]|nr:zinc-binding dehydrogenase [Gemmatimonadaceae bacterium]NUO95301.1 zinc-binding dehydrogenase [Gemmatimonadaceae bacterium]NUS47641.1 zinc-binding dehydrogenase [Gemmatimonadaceae bacterium]